MPACLQRNAASKRVLRSCVTSETVISYRHDVPCMSTCARSYIVSLGLVLKAIIIEGSSTLLRCFLYKPLGVNILLISLNSAFEAVLQNPDKLVELLHHKIRVLVLSQVLVDIIDK